MHWQPATTTHVSMILRESQQLIYRARPKQQTKARQKMWRSRVSIPVPPACKAGALPFELHPQGRQEYATKGDTIHSSGEQKENCANRESNPALKLGKLQCYRYTIGARLVKVTKVGVEEQGFDPCACRLRTDRSTE
jgi:hypothetical protein